MSTVLGIASARQYSVNKDAGNSMMDEQWAFCGLHSPYLLVPQELIVASQRLSQLSARPTSVGITKP